MIPRCVITEKWKMYDYVDGLGCRIWLNKYGEIIKIEDKNGRSVAVSKYSNGTLGAGFIWAPYIPMLETPAVIVDALIGASNIVNRYSNKLNRANYVVCSVDAANFINEHGSENLGDYLPVGIDVAQVLRDIKPK